MRVTIAFNRLLGLSGATVVEVFFEADQVVVDVALRRRRLPCAECTLSTSACYYTRPVFTRCRYTDIGHWKVLVRGGLRRMDCPAHGVRVEAVPFARHLSGPPSDLTSLVTVDGDLPSARAMALIDSLRCSPSRISSRSAA